MAFPATYLDIQTAVAAKLHMNLTDDGDKIRGYIATTYAEVAAETRCFQRTATSAMTAGVSSYTLDPTVLHIELLTVTQSGASAGPPLKEVSLNTLRNMRWRYAGASGPARAYALVPLNQLEVWPTPSAADTMTTDYSYLPTPLSADGDIPAIPEPYASNLLEYGACVQGAEQKRDIMMLGDFQQQYAQAMQDFQKYINRKAGAYPQSFPIVMSSRGFGPHDPSSDVPIWDWVA